MKRLFWKMGSSSLELIGRVNIGGTNIEIAVDGNLAIGLINGYGVVDGNLYENPVERIIPALAPIAAKIYRDKWSEGFKIQFFKKDWDSAGKYPSEKFLKAFHDAMVDYVDEENVEILEDSAPESTRAAAPRVTLNTANLVSNLKSYQEKLANTVKYVDRALERATVLTRRKLVLSMWGADKVQAVIDRVRAEIAVLDEAVEPMEQSAAIGVKSAQRLSARIVSGQVKNQEDLSYIGQVLVPSIQETHDAIQKTVASVVSALAPLSTIDRTVRVNTGSPASFFLPTNVLDDFRDAFAVLVDFLADIPQMESGILLPLDYLRGAQMVQKTAQKSK